jgi:hypothetical protein
MLCTSHGSLLAQQPNRLGADAVYATQLVQVFGKVVKGPESGINQSANSSSANANTIEVRAAVHISHPPSDDLRLLLGPRARP